MRLPPPAATVATLAGLAGLCASASAAPSAAPTVSDPSAFHYAAPLASARTARLAANNGAIEVTPSTDGKLDVRAVVRKGDPAQVRVVTREEPTGIAVCVFYADETPEACHVGGITSHPGTDHHNGPRVDLVARVPAGVSIVASTLNGDLRAQGVTGEVRASTLNGNVDVSGGTVREASTLNGDVIARFANPPSADATFSTNNGDVKVFFPARTDASVEASTAQGELHGNVGMRVSSVPGGYGPKSGSATIGKGGPKIQARSINGDVDIEVAN
ncbi:MAG TPA: hypothetical protein VGI39_06345 [Polyangiaceae bacterium]|jgi:hypothetical protein